MTEPPRGEDPPQPPFSRESQIRVDRDGAFWHDGAPVTHPGLAEAFARWVARDPATGRYILRNDVNWCFITVDDAPLIVRRLEETAGDARVHLSDGTSEALDAETLRLGEGDVPYCDVRKGTLPARFSRQAAFALLSAAQVGQDGPVKVRVGGREIVIRRR